jgi:sugar/nucleoside kinase (ribokinase family)
MTGAGRLIGIGSVVVDVLATVPDLPPRGGDVWASRMRMAAGGGFHALAAAARRGVPGEYAGAHGTGPFGDLARGALQTEGIAVRLAPRPDVDTGVVVVLVDGDGERTFVSGRGAETTLGPADLAEVAPAAGDVVLVSGYGLDDALAGWVAALPDAVVVAFDPGPLVRSAPFARVKGRLDWLSANAAEGAGLTGATDPSAAARLLGGRAGAIVRTGERGCVLAVAGAEPVALPVVPAAGTGATGGGIDTTGAGDVHTGAFVAALLRGASPVYAARAANAAAAGWVATGSYGD